MADQVDRAFIQLHEIVEVPQAEGYRKWGHSGNRVKLTALSDGGVDVVMDGSMGRRNVCALDRRQRQELADWLRNLP